MTTDPTPLDEVAPVPWWAEAQAIREAVATFPIEFGLRGFPGKRFILNEASCFVSEGRVYLYTFVLSDTGAWLAFAKGTPEELRREVTP
jgi:hypothetical protein